MSDNDTKKVLCCSFCEKSQHEVNQLVAGPGVQICNECHDLMQTLFYPDGQTDSDQIIFDDSHKALSETSQYRNYMREKTIGEFLHECGSIVDVIDLSFDEFKSKLVKYLLRELKSEIESSSE